MTEVKLHSERLTIRFTEMSDLDAIHALHLLPKTDEFNTLGIPETVQETASILETWCSGNKEVESNHLVFVIEQTEGDSFIGLIALRIGSKKFKNGEVWYKLHSDFWGNGYGTEALSTILDFGFDTLKLHRIEAGCAIDNIGSIRILEKVGMTREGRKRKVLPLKSGWSDNFEYAILESDQRNK